MGTTRAVLAGLGTTGMSVVRYLLARDWQLSVTDSRTNPPGLESLRTLAPRVRVALGALDEALLADVDCVIASPGLALTDPFFVTARGLGLPVIGDIELFARSGAHPVVGITGTNGKSTVTTLVAKMAEHSGIRVRAGGNLGPPALDLLGGEPLDLYVLELSSYQLETTSSLELAAAAVLNVTPDHLDRYADRDGVRGGQGAHLFARAHGGGESGRPARAADGAGCASPHQLFAASRHGGGLLPHDSRRQGLAHLSRRTPARRG